MKCVKCGGAVFVLGGMSYGYDGPKCANCTIKILKKQKRVKQGVRRGSG